MQQGVTAVVSMQKEISLIRSAEGSSCVRNKVKSLFGSCKSAGHDSSSVCAIANVTQDVREKLNTAALLTPLNLVSIHPEL